MRTITQIIAIWAAPPGQRILGGAFVSSRPVVEVRTSRRCVPDWGFAIWRQKKAGAFGTEPAQITHASRLPTVSSSLKNQIAPNLHANYFATGIVNSAPLLMLSGQRCITLLYRV
ncbi:hypothetical protein QFZ96_001947 [Paraburkholderia youngii]